MGYLKLYTKTPAGEEYPSALAYSIHMAYSRDGIHFESCNKGYGMLFAKGRIQPDNTILEMGIQEPVLLRGMHGGYGIAALLATKDGNQTGESIYWYAEDCIHFREETETKFTEKLSIPLKEMKQLVRQRREKDTDGIFEIPDECGEHILLQTTPLHHTGVRPIPLHTITAREELSKIGVDTVYSDGSVHHKRVKWDDSGVDYNMPGIYDIPGRIQQEIYRFPLAKGYADPVLFYYENSWYFIATNDNTDDVGLFVRKAGCIEGLFAEDVKEYCILEQDEKRGLIQTFWAPEFHILGNSLYIFFAVSGKQWGPQSHIMKLKQGGSIINKDDWENPIRVKRKNGRPLTEEGITLDMTPFKVKGTAYLVWSERYRIGTSLDSGSMLYIATIAEDEPDRLTSDPVLLSRPLYGWEHQYGTINNEGPYALQTEEKIYLAYSGGSAGGYSYVVGFLTADKETDLLNPDSWQKSPYPELSSFHIKGEYGPGHNSFFTDQYGDTYVAYHAKERVGMEQRCTGIRRVHFDSSKKPVLGMSIEEDLKENLANVVMQIEICPKERI